MFVHTSNTRRVSTIYCHVGANAYTRIRVKCVLFFKPFKYYFEKKNNSYNSSIGINLALKL